MFDGSNVSLYLDGVLAQSVSADGAFQRPARFAQILSIGGDSTYYNSSDKYFTGKIAVANLYSSALTAQQVKEKYDAL